MDQFTTSATREKELSEITGHDLSKFCPTRPENLATLVEDNGTEMADLWDEASQYVTDLKLVTVIPCMCLSCFFMFIDTMVVSTVRNLYQIGDSIVFLSFHISPL